MRWERRGSGAATLLPPSTDSGQAYGGERWRSGTLPTDRQYTGQRRDLYINLYQMGARWYDPYLGRWISPDTIIPDLANPQSLNRYSYVRNRPLNRIDPSGHQDTPPPQETIDAIREAIAYFESLGWQVVGDPTLLSARANGPDIVFTAEEGARVLAVEVKNVAGQIDLGTLGKAVTSPDYGGSIERLARSSWRLYESSNEQLRLMCQTTRDAYDAGTLENALYASSKSTGVSQKAQELFNGVYRATSGGQVEAVKSLDDVATATGAGASTAATTWEVFKAWATEVGSTTFPTVILVPRFWFDNIPGLQEEQS